MSPVAPRGNRPLVPSLLGRQMASEGLALASVPVPSCGSWKASHLPTPQKAEPLLETSGSSQHWGLCSTGELWPLLRAWNGFGWEKHDISTHPRRYHPPSHPPLPPARPGPIPAPLLTHEAETLPAPPGHKPQQPNPLDLPPRDPCLPSCRCSTASRATGG